MNGSVSGPASRTIARPHSASLDRLIPATARGGALLIVALAGLSLPLSGSMAHARSGWTGVVAVVVEGLPDPELNAEDGSGTIDFTPQFAQ